MFHAHAAGVRSADLFPPGRSGDHHRQRFVAVGSNEVPAFGGGAYWTGQAGDARDFQLGQDANAPGAGRGDRGGPQRPDRRRLAAARQVQTTGRPRSSPLYSPTTRVDQLTEFGRAVHAEMAAILDAARRGQTVQGGTLYSTTFPCHNCAKHIVGAGLEHVVYIAPYPKSLAEDLHPDTIAIDPADPPADRVVFRPFVGVAPLAYLPIFEHPEKRKTDDGHAVEFVASGARPKLVIGWGVGCSSNARPDLVTLKTTLREQNVRLRRRRGASGPDAALTGVRRLGRASHARSSAPRPCSGARRCPPETTRPSTADSAPMTAPSPIGPSSCSAWSNACCPVWSPCQPLKSWFSESVPAKVNSPLPGPE